MNPRRAYLLHARSLEAEGREGLAAVYRGRQLALPGAPLPDSVPHQDALRCAGYSALEDLEGADEGELVSWGLKAKEAQEVFAALNGPAAPEAPKTSPRGRRPSRAKA